MPFDENWVEVPSPAAQLDELEDRRFHSRNAQAAADLAPPRPAPDTITPARLDEFAENVGAFVADMLRPIVKRIEKIENSNVLARGAVADLLSTHADRISSLESETRLRFCGVYEAGQTYHKGSLVSADGSLFYCHCGTDKRPGTTHDWQLCCKRGRDAK